MTLADLERAERRSVSLLTDAARDREDAALPKLLKCLRLRSAVFHHNRKVHSQWVVPAAPGRIATMAFMIFVECICDFGRFAIFVVETMQQQIHPSPTLKRSCNTWPVKMLLSY